MLSKHQIKFRVWDQVRKEWVPVFMLDEWGSVFESNSNWKWEEYGEPWEEHERAIATMFTGLKDSQGADIFEGDYISYKPDGETEEVEGVVEIENIASGALVNVSSENKRFQPLHGIHKIAAVTGNIFEKENNK
jgi:hypothetical protein